MRLIVALIVAACVGCEEPAATNAVRVRYGTHVSTMQYDGHDYVVLDGVNGTSGICHKANCRACLPAEAPNQEQP